MGTYNCSPQEIIDAITESLDCLEGEVYRKDFEYACEEILNEYKHFTDRKKKGRQPLKERRKE